VTWTTFANLTAPTLPELDDNFEILTYLAPVQCTFSGPPNAIILTPSNAGTPLSAYQQNMIFESVSTFTNTGATTVQVAGFPGVYNVYQDTTTGPVALVGGEIVANCAIGLIFDFALNSGAGGFHLLANNGLIQNSSISTILTSNGSISGNLTIAGIASVGTVNAGLIPSVLGTNGSLSGPLTVGTISGVTGTLSGVLSAASVSFAGGDALIRLNSTLASITNVTLTPGSSATVSLTGFAAAGVNDAIFVAGNTSTDFSSLSFRGYVPATGTIIVGVQNALTATTLTLTTVSFRMVDMGFVT
jgi:hypothetical protein